MLRIAEEHTKKILKNPKIFFHLGDFPFFSKITILRKNLKFRFQLEFHLKSIEFSDFFSRNFDFEKFKKFENLKINFRQDEKIFFVRIFLNCLGIFFRNPKHVFRAPMIPSERCYSA